MAYLTCSLTDNHSSAVTLSALGPISITAARNATQRNATRSRNGNGPLETLTYLLG